MKDAATRNESAFLVPLRFGVDGQDVEPAVRGARSFGMMCRTISTVNGLPVSPRRNGFARAVREAKESWRFEYACHRKADSDGSRPERAGDAGVLFAARHRRVRGRTGFECRARTIAARG